MRVSSAFILLAVIAVAWAIPAPKVTKESSIDDVEIEKKDLKIGEEIGDDKERAKKSATFCVEVRSGSQHAKAVPCGCAQTPCGCNKENHEEMDQTPCGCHKHQPHKIHQTVHTVHIVQQNEESKEQSKEESKEEPCEEVTTPAPVVLESTILPETTTPEVVVTEPTTVPPTTESPTTVPPTTVPATTVPPTTTTAEVEIVTEPPKSEKMVEQPCKEHMVVVQMQPPRCQHHAVITECDCKPPSMPVPVMPMPMMEGMYPMVKDHPMHHLFKERMHMMPGMAHMMPGVAHKIEKWTKV